MSFSLSMTTFCTHQSRASMQTATQCRAAGLSIMTGVDTRRATLQLVQQRLRLNKEEFLDGI
jgi:hypothetical protein